jgi:hypothetical protein
MIFHKFLLCTAVIACLIIRVHAMPPMLVEDPNDLDWTGSSPGDPLDPGFVGETMDMPLDMDLVNEAKDAGIIKESNPLYKTAGKSSSTYLGSTPPAGAESYDSALADTSSQNANVTGPWSLDLIALDQIMRHLSIALVQNNDAVIGYGVMSEGNDTAGDERIVASGAEAGGRLNLNVMPIGSMDLYKLDLSLDLHTTGTYSAYSAGGDTWSGDVAGTAPLGILTPGAKAMDVQKGEWSQSGPATKAAAV